MRDCGQSTKIYVFDAIMPWSKEKVYQIDNSLAPGRCECNLELIVLKVTSRKDILSIPCEITFRWTPQNSLMISQYYISPGNGLVP